MVGKSDAQMLAILKEVYQKTVKGSLGINTSWALLLSHALPEIRLG